MLGDSKDVRTVEPLVARLKAEPDYDIRVAVIEALGMIGGVRAIDPPIIALKEHVIVGHHFENFEVHGGGRMRVSQAALKVLGEIGDEQAVEPLLMFALENKHMAKQVIGNLGRILERSLDGVSLEVIRYIAGMQDVARFTYGWSCAFVVINGEEPVDCSLLRQLARQELIRRGLEA